MGARGLRRPRAPRAAAAAVALGVIALSVAGCGGRGTNQGATSTTGPPAVAAKQGSTAPPDASSYKWNTDTDPALAVGGGATSTLATVLAPVSTDGSEWQIVGTRTAADGTDTATVWTSPDALTWHATPLPGTDTEARAASTWNGRTIVVGSTGSGDGERAAAWLSPAPGQPFQRVNAGAVFAPPPTNGKGPTGGAEMDVVAAGGLGVFATGQVAGVEAVWYSTDARHWSRLKGAEQAIDGGTDPQVHSLLVGANGVFAAGSVLDGSTTDGAIWSSTDGISWHHQSDKQAFTGDGNRSITGLVSLGTGFVAAGAVQSGQASSPASWISPNGNSWSTANLAFPMPSGSRPDDGGSEVRDLASTTSQPAASTTATGDLAAVGGSRVDQRLWTSKDGLSWTSVPLPTGAAQAADWRAGQVATTGEVTVVVDDSTGSPRVLVNRAQGWTEVSADPAVFGVPQPTTTPVRLLEFGANLLLVARVDQPGQTLGTETSSAAVFTSPDGRTWTAANDAPFVGRTVRDATALASGVTTVGGVTPLTSTLAAGPTGAAAWSSGDGRTWTQATGTFGGGGSGPAQADAVTRLDPSTLVAVGRASTSPTGPADRAVAWTSTDGHAWGAPEPLDPTAGLGVERPAGVCAGPQSVVAVGSGVTSGPGSVALAWTSRDGQHWSADTVTPTPQAGLDEQMTSCLSAGNGGFIAFGSSEASDGSEDAAIWVSNDGVHWNRQDVAAFADTGLGPIRDLAVGGTTWLAVSGTDTPTTAPGGGLGLWRTTDAGSTWDRLDTTGAPWDTAENGSLDRVVLDHDTAVVAGSVDGRLTVWTGTPTSGSGTTSGSSTTSTTGG